MNKPTFTYIKNPNKEEFEMVSEAIKANDNYCCCAIEKTDDTKCMCKDFRESEVSGFCHCRRYYKVRNNERIAILVDITEDAGANAFQTWFTNLTQKDFIVIPVIYNSYDLTHQTEQHIDVSKVAISQCQAVFVINTDGENEDFISEMVEWAQDLDKKIIFRSDLYNEDRQA